MMEEQGNDNPTAHRQIAEKQLIMPQRNAMGFSVDWSDSEHTAEQAAENQNRVIATYQALIDGLKSGQ